MMKRTILSALITLGMAAPAAFAAGAGAEISDTDFSFEGPFGSYDTHQLQRGLQVFTETCASCHGLQYVAYRTLHDEGGPALPEDQVKAYAAQFEAPNTANDDGELGELRPATPNDHFGPSQFEGAPDLSLMAKARAGFHGPGGLGINQLLFGMGGPEYIVAILTGYTGETKEEAGALFYENHAFPGGWISMPPPLVDGMVDYADGHSNSTQHISADVAAFLMWTAEPHLNARKQAGFTAFIMLVLFGVLLYLTNKALWAKVKRKA
ncbi:MAG: cytochrome c1 [Paracoccaceae bacterium]